MFANLDRVVSKVFLWGLPLVLCMAIAITFIDQTNAEQQTAFAQILNPLAGLIFGLWMSFALYMSIRLVLSNTTRNAILSRLVFLRDRDEREQFLTGNATKINFLFTLSILILLLCLCAFQMSIYRIPVDQAPAGKDKTITLGLGFNLLDSDEPRKKDTPPEGSTILFDYSGLPISKTAIILFLIIWQIAAYNYFVNRLSKKGADIYA